MLLISIHYQSQGLVKREGKTYRIDNFLQQWNSCSFSIFHLLQSSAQASGQAPEQVSRDPLNNLPFWFTYWRFENQKTSFLEFPESKKLHKNPQ